MYIAQKPVNFGGHDFLIGEEIPAELVDHAKVPQLIKQRIIADAPGDYPSSNMEKQTGIVRFSIPAHVEEGDIELELTRDEIVSVTDVLQAKSEYVAGMIDGITSGDALILIDVCDQRKGIKKLAKERAAVLFPDEPESKDGEGEA